MVNTHYRINNLFTSKIIGNMISQKLIYATQHQNRVKQSYRLRKYFLVVPYRVIGFNYKKAKRLNYEYYFCRGKRTTLHYLFLRSIGGIC